MHGLELGRDGPVGARNSGSHDLAVVGREKLDKG
jgi:hypothetical protein